MKEKVKMLENALKDAEKPVDMRTKQGKELKHE